MSIKPLRIKSARFKPDSKLVDAVHPAVNKGPRRGVKKPSLLILHYTGMSSAVKAVDWLARKESRSHAITSSMKQATSRNSFRNVYALGTPAFPTGAARPISIRILSASRFKIPDTRTAIRISPRRK